MNWKKYNIISYLTSFKTTIVYKKDEYTTVTKHFDNDRQAEKFVNKLQNNGYNLTYTQL